MLLLIVAIEEFPIDKPRLLFNIILDSIITSEKAVNIPEWYKELLPLFLIVKFFIRQSPKSGVKIS